MSKLKSDQELLEFVETVINTVPEPLITLDKDLRIVTVNRFFYTFFKLKPEKTIGHLILELDNKRWNIPALRELLETILPHKTSVDDYMLEHDFTDIGRRILMLNASQIEQAGSKKHRFLLSIRDTTERSDELVIANQELAYQKKETQGLLQSLKRATNVFTRTHEGIMVTDANAKIVEINSTFSQITGYTFEEVLGKNPKILKSGYHSPEFFIEMWSTLSKQGNWCGEVWNRRKNGEVYPEILTISAVKNAQGLVQQYVSLFTDITSMQAHRRQPQHIAHYDPLTDLPNRVLLV
jgi:PAS domain S-box-containing protein